MQLPEAFAQQAQELLGQEYPAFEESLSTNSPVSIRINQQKPVEIAFQEQIPWCETGYYLPSRPIFTIDPLFHAGCYYVQEASSMFIGQAIKQVVSQPIVALDLCAAPGGKSTLLSSLLPEGSLLIANEVIGSRAQILVENLCKWGNPATLVTQNDPKDLGKLPQCFDLILADVPCSGEGMFRKDKQAIQEWSPNNVRLCAERQQRIIRDIWPALKPGGILIYSTCTYNTLENEDNIQWITEELGAHALTINTPTSQWNICEAKKGNHPAYRFFPHKTKGEGFFMAVLQKTDDHIEVRKPSKSKEKNKTPQPKVNIPPIVHSWINQPEDFLFSLKGNNVTAFPKTHQEMLSVIEKGCRLIMPGIHLAEIKGKDIIPQHALVMSTVFYKQAFPTYETDEKTALQYLRKEAINTLPENMDRGFIVLTYKQHRLGLVKNIGSRANNLYPAEWRIRKLL